MKQKENAPHFSNPYLIIQYLITRRRRRRFPRPTPPFLPYSSTRSMHISFQSCSHSSIIADSGHIAVLVRIYDMSEPWTVYIGSDVRIRGKYVSKHGRRGDRPRKYAQCSNFPRLKKQRWVKYHMKVMRAEWVVIRHVGNVKEMLYTR